MRSRTIKLVLLLGVIILIPIALSVARKIRDDRRFDPTKLIGLSTAEVERILGRPDFIEETNTWLYFRGTTPAAALDFSDGRLRTLERLK